MLRHPETLTAAVAVAGADDTVHVSAGTAAVLGLRRLRQLDPPTTAYLMVGEHCVSDCTFCAQARSSIARCHFLSRVVWPLYPLEDVLAAVADGFGRLDILRCCLQVTVSDGYFPRTLSLVRQLRSFSPIPISVSIALSDLESIRALLDCGVQRVALALDAACERVYREVKGSGWRRRFDLLCIAARLFPGRVGTHLIVGLGETEREMSITLQQMVDLGVGIGLFSFTPVAGTAWADRAAPSLASYRRIQAAHCLIATRACRVQDISFSASGEIVSYGLRHHQLRELLRDGRAFQTAGCAGCNRPYYNERPGRSMYNYPRPLAQEEANEAVSSVMAGLALELSPTVCESQRAGRSDLP